VQLGARTVRLDIASGGELYAIVDSESVGVPIDAAHAAQLVRAGMEIRDALKSPAEIQGTIFTAPPRGLADLRSATVLYGGHDGNVERGILKRSPGLAGTCALMAVLDAMGLLEDQTFTHEGVMGTTLKGRVLSRRPATDSEPASVTPMVEGPAFITGRHEFQIDDGDPTAPFAI
jgi:proline racemase